MPRTARHAPGGMLFHVLNRGVGRRCLFDREADYAAFERIIAETLDKCPLQLCAWCLMPNHWHFVVWPARDGDLAASLPIPRDWRTLVDRPQTEAEVEAIRRSIRRGSPFGTEAWVRRTAQALGLESTLRPRGRPKNRPQQKATA